jgi:hypothetical protein
MTARLLAAAIAAALIAPAAAGPPYAVQRIADGAIMTRVYPGAPYPIAGHRWLDVAPAPLAPVDGRLFARLPCSAVAAGARIDDPAADVVDCADSAGADELVVLADPLPTDPGAVAGTLYTGIYQADWQDTGDQPVQALAALRSLAEQQRRRCLVAAAAPESCDDVGSLLARERGGETLTLADAALVSTCAQASRDCGSPNEANRARIEALLRAAYASRLTAEPIPPPDLDTGWVAPPPAEPVAP